MASGLPKGKRGLRDSCPRWRVFSHSQPRRVDAIPGEGSGNLRRTARGLAALAHWLEEGSPSSTCTRAWELLVWPAAPRGCRAQAFLALWGCSLTHPGWRRGFRTAHSSVTKASRPGGDKLLQRLGSPDGVLGTGLRVEPTCKRWENYQFLQVVSPPFLRSTPSPGSHQVQGRMGGIGQVGAGWPTWSFPNCFLHFKEHLRPPAGKRPNESRIQTHVCPPQGQGGCFHHRGPLLGQTPERHRQVRRHGGDWAGGRVGESRWSFLFPSLDRNHFEGSSCACPPHPMWQPLDSRGGGVSGWMAHPLSPMGEATAALSSGHLAISRGFTTQSLSQVHTHQHPRTSEGRALGS